MPFKRKTYDGKPLLLERVSEMARQSEYIDFSAGKDFLGLYFGYDDIHYLNTPLDAVSFAWPGADGIHFAFLTDFSTADSLEEAYIVRVEPMSFDDPVKIVARDFKDFLRLLCYYPIAIELAHAGISENDFTALAKRYPSLITGKPDYYYEQGRGVAQKVIEAFGLEPFGDVFDYLRDLHIGRLKKVVFHTWDGIGIAGVPEDTTSLKRFPLKRQKNPAPEHVRDYMSTASEIEILGLIRDLRSMGLFHHQWELIEIAKKQLLSMGLRREAGNLDEFDE
ncbi:hypothetical protein KP806_18820 [Paenibacillus sp. N4]|uniref:hypothetical protein n=1 Tax=Paenibacillus vietnamensis TaxID=2590547 RepID=UPI001CD0F1B9|nr:hypothetical protein [Paenibacillus vietnamensis]MCA0757120.1 hypothetical protein [Paenibacillus vietnamensis]